MQPIRGSTILEEVNDSNIPMEPLHSPVATPVVEQQLVSMQAVSVNGQICTAQTAADAEREVHRRHQGSRLAGRTLKLLDGPEGMPKFSPTI